MSLEESLSLNLDDALERLDRLEERLNSIAATAGTSISASIQSAIDSAAGAVSDLGGLIERSIAAGAQAGSAALVEALKDVTVDVNVLTDTSRVQSEIEGISGTDVTVGVGADVAGAQGAVDAIEAPTLDVGINADTQAVQSEIDGVTADGVVLPVTADVAPVESAIGGLTADPITTTVEAETSGAQDHIDAITAPDILLPVDADISRAEERVGQITADPITVEVDADPSRALPVIEGLAAPDVTIVPTVDLAEVQPALDGIQDPSVGLDTSQAQLAADAITVPDIEAPVTIDERQAQESAVEAIDQVVVPPIEIGTTVETPEVGDVDPVVVPVNFEADVQSLTDGVDEAIGAAAPPIEVPAEVEVDGHQVAEFADTVEPVVIPADLDTSEATDDLDRLAQSDVVVPVATDVDTTAVEEALGTIEPPDLTVPVDADVTRAESSVDDLRDELEGLSATPVTTVVDAPGLNESITGFDQLSDRIQEIQELGPVSVDTSAIGGGDGGDGGDGGSSAFADSTEQFVSSAAARSSALTGVADQLSNLSQFSEAAVGGGRGIVSLVGESLPVFGVYAAATAGISTAVSHLTHAALPLASAEHQVNEVFGEQAEALNQIAGIAPGLTGTMEELALKTGSAYAGVLAGEAKFGRTGAQAGYASEQTAGWSRQLGVLANYLAATNSNLGPADQIIGRLQTSLGRGGLATDRLGLSIGSAGAIARRAAEDFGKPVKELTLYEKQVTGLQIALEKVGPDLNDKISDGVENPVIAFRALKNELHETLAAAGLPILEPLLQAMKTALPIVTNLGGLFGKIAQADLPIFFAAVNPIVDILGKLLGLVSQIPGPVLAGISTVLVFGKAWDALRVSLQTIPNLLAKIFEKFEALSGAKFLDKPISGLRKLGGTADQIGADDVGLSAAQAQLATARSEALALNHADIGKAIEGVTAKLPGLGAETEVAFSRMAAAQNAELAGLDNLRKRSDDVAAARKAAAAAPSDATTQQVTIALEQERQAAARIAPLHVEAAEAQSAFQAKVVQSTAALNDQAAAASRVSEAQVAGAESAGVSARDVSAASQVTDAAATEAEAGGAAESIGDVSSGATTYAATADAKERAAAKIAAAHRAEAVAAGESAATSVVASEAMVSASEAQVQAAERIVTADQAVVGSMEEVGAAAAVSVTGLAEVEAAERKAAAASTESAARRKAATEARKLSDETFTAAIGGDAVAAFHVDDRSLAAATAEVEAATADKAAELAKDELTAARERNGIAADAETLASQRSATATVEEARATQSATIARQAETEAIEAEAAALAAQERFAATQRLAADRSAPEGASAEAAFSLPGARAEVDRTAAAATLARARATEAAAVAERDLAIATQAQATATAEATAVEEINTGAVAENTAVNEAAVEIARLETAAREAKIAATEAEATLLATQRTASGPADTLAEFGNRSAAQAALPAAAAASAAANATAIATTEELAAAKLALGEASLGAAEAVGVQAVAEEANTVATAANTVATEANAEAKVLSGGASEVAAVEGAGANLAGAAAPGDPLGAAELANAALTSGIADEGEALAGGASALAGFGSALGDVAAVVGGIAVFAWQDHTAKIEAHRKAVESATASIKKFGETQRDLTNAEVSKKGGAAFADLRANSEDILETTKAALEKGKKDNDGAITTIKEFFGRDRDKISIEEAIKQGIDLNNYAKALTGNLNAIGDLYDQLDHIDDDPSHKRQLNPNIKGGATRATQQQVESAVGGADALRDLTKQAFVDAGADAGKAGEIAAQRINEKLRAAGITAPVEITYDLSGTAKALVETTRASNEALAQMRAEAIQEATLDQERLANNPAARINTTAIRAAIVGGAIVEGENGVTREMINTFDVLLSKADAVNKQAEALAATASERAIQEDKGTLSPALERQLDAIDELAVGIARTGQIASSTDLGEIRALRASDAFNGLTKGTQDQVNSILAIADAEKKAALDAGDLISANGEIVQSFESLNDELSKAGQAYIGLLQSQHAFASDARETDKAIRDIGKAIEENGSVSEAAKAKADPSKISVENYSEYESLLTKDQRDRINETGEYAKKKDKKKSTTNFPGRDASPEEKQAFDEQLLWESQHGGHRLKKDEEEDKGKSDAQKAAEVRAAVESNAKAIGTLTDKAKDNADALARAYNTAGIAVRQSVVDIINAGGSLQQALDYTRQKRSEIEAELRGQGVSQAEIAKIIGQERLTDQAVQEDLGKSELGKVAVQRQILLDTLEQINALRGENIFDIPAILSIEDADKQLALINRIKDSLPKQQQTAIDVALKQGTLEAASKAIDDTFSRERVIFATVRDSSDRLGTRTNADGSTATPQQQVEQALAEAERFVAANPKLNIQIDSNVVETIALLDRKFEEDKAHLLKVDPTDAEGKIAELTKDRDANISAVLTEVSRSKDPRKLLDDITAFVQGDHQLKMTLQFDPAGKAVLKALGFLSGEAEPNAQTTGRAGGTPGLANADRVTGNRPTNFPGFNIPATPSSGSSAPVVPNLAVSAFVGKLPVRPLTAAERSIIGDPAGHDAKFLIDFMVNRGAKLPGYAAGGLTVEPRKKIEPEVAKSGFFSPDAYQFAEPSSQGEYVISRDPQYREQNQGLLTRAAADLNLTLAAAPRAVPPSVKPVVVNNYGTPGLGGDGGKLIGDLQSTAADIIRTIATTRGSGPEALIKGNVTLISRDVEEGADQLVRRLTDAALLTH